MRRLLIPAAVGLIAVAGLAAPVAAQREFGAAYIDDSVYRVFGNPANVPDGTGTDPFAIFTNSENADQFGVAKFAPGSAGGHHGGRWAIYRATWTSGDATSLVTSWSQLKALESAGDLVLVRDPAADFRCPVLGDPRPL